MDATAKTVANISFFDGLFPFVTNPIKVEHTITPPVTSVYCIEAGKYKRDIKRNQLAMVLIATPPPYIRLFTK